MESFKLWLEFEAVGGEWEEENDFCNIRVDLPDGRHYGINVWTYRFLQTAVEPDVEGKKNLGGLYLVPPDLFVKELTRECIQKAIHDLLKTGDLEKVLNPTVLGTKS